MTSNLDRYTYSKYCQESASEKITLVHMEPRLRLVTWALYATNVYSRAVDHFVIGLTKDGTAATAVNSIAEVNGSMKYYFDVNGKKIYFYSTTDPVNYAMYATIRLFFSNAPINLPYDLNEGREVEYDPRIRSTSKFKNQLDEDNLGVSLEGQGRVSFHNEDQFFDDKFETYVWENAETVIYSYNRFLKPSDNSILFRGVVKEKKYGNRTVEFIIKDFIERLSEGVPLNLFTSSDGDIPDSLIGTPKRRIYGRVAGLKVRSLDNILGGFTLSGKFTVAGNSKLVYGNEDSEILDEVSPDDQVIIDNITIKVSQVEETYFILSEEVSRSLVNVDITIIPAIPYRRRNRRYLIADHALRQAETFVNFAINENRFYIDNIIDLEHDDIIFIGSEYRQIRRLIGNLIVLWTNLSSVPVPYTIVLKRPVYSVYFDKDLLSIEDYSIENSAAGSFLTISEEAEKNLTREKPINGILTFIEGSRIINTAKTLLSGQSTITENSDLVHAIGSDLTGAVQFVNGSKLVNAGAIDVQGEATFTNGQTLVHTKRTAISGMLKFTKDSKTVVSNVRSLLGKPLFTNMNAIVENLGSQITGESYFENASVKVKCRQAALTGRIFFQQGVNYVEAYSNDISGKISFVQGSDFLKMYFDILYGTNIKFTQFSNDVIGTNTLFTSLAEDDDYIRPPGTLKKYKIKTVHSDTYIELWGQFEEATTQAATAELIKESYLTAFIEEVSVNDFIRPQAGVNYYEVLTGIMNFVNGSNEIHGVGTAFSSEVAAGDKVRPIGTEKNYIIDTSVPTYYGTIHATYVTFTNNNPFSSGFNSHFTTDLKVGDYLRPPGQTTWNKIKTIISDVQLEYETDYIGPNLSPSDPEHKRDEYLILQEPFGEVSQLGVQGEVIKEAFEGSFKRYQIAEIVNDEKVRLTTVYDDESIRDEAIRIDETKFLTEIGIGDYIRDEDTSAFFKVIYIYFDWRLRIEFNFPNDDTYGQGYITRPFYLTKYLTEISPGTFIRPPNNGKWYKVSEILSDVELNLDAVYEEASINNFVKLTSFPSYFTSDLMAGDNIRVIGESWYEVQTVHNDSKITLTSNYLGTTGEKFVQYIDEPARFLSEISAGSWVRPDGAAYDWYEVKRVESDEELILVKKFGTDIETNSFVTETPTFFKTATGSDKINPGDSIKPVTGPNYFIIDSITNDSELLLTLAYSDTTASAAIKKLTNPTVFLAEVTPGQWIKGNYDGAKFYQVQTVISNSQLQLFNQFAETSTPIITAFISNYETRYLEELSPGDTIQLENGSEWCEVLSIIDNGRLKLVNMYVKPTESGNIYRITPGSFLSQVKSRDFIRSQSDGTFYEILQVVNNFRMILREEYRTGSVIESALVKNVKYIEDSSDITVETMGKTFNGEPTGEFIKTASDVVKDLLIEAGLESKMNMTSFQNAKEEAPYLISLSLPIDLSQTIAPKLKDVFDLINESVFGSVYNDVNYKINFSIMSTRKPAAFTVLTETDILESKVNSNSKALIKTAIVQYKFRDIDIFGGGSPFNTASHTSELISNLAITTKTKTIQAYLYDYEAAKTLAQRVAFAYEVAKSQVEIEGKLNLSKFSLHDILVLELDRMFQRYGSLDNKSKIGIVTSIEKDGSAATVIIDDLSNGFNRISNLANDSAFQYDLASERERMLNGYITDENGLINNTENTFGINKIG